MNATEFARDLEQRLSYEENTKLTPDILAQLFGLTFQQTPHSRSLLYVLHRYLLMRTMRHAKGYTKYYSDECYESQISNEPQDVPDLSCWPMITRDDVINNLERFLAHNVTFESVCHTSGSTGSSLSIYKSFEELSFLWSYYKCLFEPTYKLLWSIPLILFFPNQYHGVGLRLPSLGKVFVSGVTDDLLIRDAVKVLEKTYNIPGHDSKISIISGLSFHIKFFTNYLFEQGYDPRDFEVRSINIVGSYESSRARQFLAESWGALVFDRFTLTESVGGANRCHKCDHFHMEPHVVAEVIEAESGKNIDQGVGYLVLTQLYPFVQMQPLIRYVTGDLVSKKQTDCTSTLTFDFLGKAANCISWEHGGRSEWLVFSADLSETLNEIPDLNLVDSFINVTTARDTSVGSSPIFVQKTFAENGLPFRINLTFELRYTPHYFADRVVQIRQKLLKGLRSANKTLCRRLDEGAVVVNVDFVGPGTLGESCRIKV